MQKIVRQISELKDEPEWMLEFRLNALEIFESKPTPDWGGDISIDFQDIYYYLKPTDKQGKTWDDVPQEIKETFDKLGIPEAEKKFLAGVKAQFESEVVYGSLKEDLQEQGVIFTDTDTALREHSDLLREYFATIIPPHDNKMAALNSAVWSGGSFIYVPPGVHIDFPLQAYFRINAENMGQFERTLIICDEGSQIHYVEGCTAPMYSTESLHSAVVEIIVQTRRQMPVHDYPELGKQYLQPGHEAGGCLPGRHDGVDRRQPGQQADDEVSSRIHDGTRCPRRDPVDRFFLGRSTPGCRRQTGALRTQHHRPDRLEVDLEERRTQQLSRTRQSGKRGH